MQELPLTLSLTVAISASATLLLRTKSGYVAPQGSGYPGSTRDTARAMSQENVEIVRRGFTATLEGDWPTALATLDTDVEVRDFDIPDAGVYRGHEGFREWLSNWGESWEEWRLEDIEFRPAVDDQVIALFTMVTKGKGSGIEVKRGDAIVYCLSGGKIARTEYFNDQDRALKAAGLRQ